MPQVATTPDTINDPSDKSALSQDYSELETSYCIPYHQALTRARIPIVSWSRKRLHRRTATFTLLLLSFVLTLGQPSVLATVPVTVNLVLPEMCVTAISSQDLAYCGDDESLEVKQEIIRINGRFECQPYGFAEPYWPLCQYRSDVDAKPGACKPYYFSISGRDREQVLGQIKQRFKLYGYSQAVFACALAGWLKVHQPHSSWCAGQTVAPWMQGNLKFLALALPLQEALITAVRGLRSCVISLGLDAYLAEQIPHTGEKQADDWKGRVELGDQPWVLGQSFSVLTVRVDELNQRFIETLSAQLYLQPIREVISQKALRSQFLWNAIIFLSVMDSDFYEDERQALQEKLAQQAGAWERVEFLNQARLPQFMNSAKRRKHLAPEAAEGNGSGGVRGMAEASGAEAVGDAHLQDISIH